MRGDGGICCPFVVALEKISTNMGKSGKLNATDKCVVAIAKVIVTSRGIGRNMLIVY